MHLRPCFSFFRNQMLISHEYRFLFIHVWKTAGTSIEQALEPFAQAADGDRQTLFPEAHGLLPALPRAVPLIFPRHAGIASARERLPSHVFESYFKFGFVRNPWDLEVSQYHYSCQTEWVPENDLVRSLGSFEKYILHKVSRDESLSVATQSSFLTDAEGALLVDFVGRFERLAEDLARVCEVLGIEASLKHLNPTIHEDYRTFYTERSRTLVEEMYREDISRFQYDFDPG